MYPQKWRGTELDDNQNYVLIRRSVIAFFAKGEDKLLEYGYQVSDFEPCMKFLTKIYKEALQYKENIQC